MATISHVTKFSLCSTFHPMIDARISSMLRPSLTGTSPGSREPPTSNRVKSVWHEGHMRAAASIGESQTGQTFVSCGDVSRHLEYVDASLACSCGPRLSGLSSENGKSYRGH